MRILGLDPGTATTGFACIDVENSHIKLVDVGCIKTSSKLALADRLFELAEDLNKLLKKWRPDTLAIEKIFFAKNVKTGITVAHARGAIVYLAQKHNLEICEYSPTEIKIAVTGDGHADKLQIQKMVMMICNLDRLPKSDDAADALAIALCHSASRKFML